MKYSREDGCKAWLTYGAFQADHLSAVLQEYGTAEKVYDKFLAYGDIVLKGHCKEYGLSQLKTQSSRQRMHEMMVTMQKFNMGIISQEDADYPDSLRNIQSPPPILFYRGNLSCLRGKCISVVGARNASVQGIDATRTICADLSRNGATIVSGFAMGIDAAAHEGCIEGGSPTVAVLGCGLDVDYPAENAALRERIIAHNGLLLSEYPPGVRANRFVFQARNRLISGLSRALLMMESRIQSGSMVTVHHALDQGREVYAYPGIPGTEWAQGAHQLLREGANFFTSAQDVLEDLGWAAAAPAATGSEKELPPLNDDQRLIYRYLSQGELSFDQLADRTQLPVPALTVGLTMLQMMGLVKALPGKAYAIV